MATVTRRRRPGGTSGVGCPDPCPPRLFFEPSGPETEFCLFPLALAVVVRCAGDLGGSTQPVPKRALPPHGSPGASAVLPSRRLAPRGSSPVLCLCSVVLEGRTGGSGFYSRELYLRTFFFIGGSMAPAACTRSLLYTFNQHFFRLKAKT